MSPGSATPRPEHPPSERYGPLTVTRVRKDDGRALILYAHAEDGSELAPEPPPGVEPLREQA